MRTGSLTLLTVVAVVLIATIASAQNNGSSRRDDRGPKGRPFQTLRGEITTLQNQVADLRADVAAIEEQAAGALASIQSQLDALSAQVAAQTASIEQLQAYDTLQAQKIASLGGAVLALQSAMAGVQRSVDALQLHDALMDDWRDALEQRWREADARLAANTADITLLIAADRALQEYAAALQLEVQFARTSAAEAGVAAADALMRLADLHGQLALKQNLIRGACPAGQAIRQIDVLGNVTCEFDDAGGVAAIQSTATWTSEVRAAPNSYNYGYAYCPTGYLATGGGFSTSPPLYVFHNAPLMSLGWVIGASNPSGTQVAFYAVARCLRL